MKLNDIAIIIQGPSLYVEELKNAWKGFEENIIYSTWEGSENEYNNNDNVIFNEMPYCNGDYNFNLQKISTYNGILKAKELGYKYALKIRSDFLPTNAIEFLKILDKSKINFTCWDYTTYLWKEFPTFKGYFGDHVVFGPIDYMLELWDIKDNFCSAQTMLTWSYIEKLKNKIGIKFIVPDLIEEENDLFYIKDTYNCESFGFFNYLNKFGNKNLKGRYETYFKTFRRNKFNNSEYSMDEKKVNEFLNINYLNFLKFFNPLPKISIIINSNFDENKLNNIIYAKNKISILKNVNDVNYDYIIESKDIKENHTIITEYFKKINTIYNGIKLNENKNNNNITWENAGNYINSGYKKGDESLYQSKLYTKDEYNWKYIKNKEIIIDYLQITSYNIIDFEDNLIGIIVVPIKDIIDKKESYNTLITNKIITGKKTINTKTNVFYISQKTIREYNYPNYFKKFIKIGEYHVEHLKHNITKQVSNEYVYVIGITDFLKEKNIKKINYIYLNSEYDIQILISLYDYYYNKDYDLLPNIIKIDKKIILNENSNVIDNIINLYESIGYKIYDYTFIKK